MALCEKLATLLDHELDKKDIGGIITDEKEHIEITNRLTEIVKNITPQRSEFLSGVFITLTFYYFLRSSVIPAQAGI